MNDIVKKTIENIGALGAFSQEEHIAHAAAFDDFYPFQQLPDDEGIGHDPQEHMEGIILIILQNFISL